MTGYFFKISVTQDVTPCDLVEILQRFGEECCLHLFEKGPKMAQRNFFLDIGEYSSQYTHIHHNIHIRVDSNIHSRRHHNTKP